MARTKASVGAKVAAGKSSKARCSVAPPPSSAGSTGGGERSSRSYSGGNPVCPRETPKWQKPITNFFITNNSSHDSGGEETDVAESTSKSKPKRNIIQSDDKENEEDLPKNSELDESIILEPLTGDSSHKIDEYYQKNDKGKGKGKKTNNKENIDNNTKRNSVKRDLEDINFGEESDHAVKKIKVN